MYQHTQAHKNTIHKNMYMSTDRLLNCRSILLELPKYPFIRSYILAMSTLICPLLQSLGEFFHAASTYE